MKRVIATLIMLSVFGTVYASGTVVIDSFVHPDPRIGTRLVQVYLPEGYNPSGSVDYPVIYFLHGAKDGFAPGYANHLSYPFMIDSLDQLIGNGIIHPVIVAKPNSQCSPYLISWHTNSILNGPWEDYTYTSLVNFIEGNYRAIPDPEYRFLMGHSAGGHGVFKVSLKHLNMFSAVATNSGSGLDIDMMLMSSLPLLLAEYPGGPPYYWNPLAGFISASCFSLAGAFSPNLLNPPYYVDLPLDTMGNLIPSIWQLWLDQSPTNIAAAVAPSDCPRIYMDCGTQDELGGYPQNVSLHSLFVTLGIDHIWQPYTGGHFDKLPERFPIGITFLVGLRAALDFQPTTLNLKSNGNWVTCHIQLPGDYSAADIDPSTVVLNKINGMTIDPPIYREGPYSVDNHGGKPRLMVKFNRQALVAQLSTMGIGGGQIAELGVAGELTSRIPFYDNGTVNVIGTGGPQGNEMAGKNGYLLHECTPNPFSRTTTISYEVPITARVRIRIYNALGQCVAALVNEQHEAGTYSINWEAKNLANGVYICRMEADDNTATQKMLLLK
jgi:enterochelin esterase-like enzyme